MWFNFSFSLFCVPSSRKLLFRKWLKNLGKKTIHHNFRVMSRQSNLYWNSDIQTIIKNCPCPHIPTISPFIIWLQYDLCPFLTRKDEVVCVQQSTPRFTFLVCPQLKDCDRIIPIAHTTKCKNDWVCTNTQATCSLVRSVLEYSTLVWPPGYSTYIEQICPFKLGFNRDEYTYRNISMQLETLETRKWTWPESSSQNNQWPHSVIELLEKIEFNVGARRTRHSEIFNFRFLSTNYGRNETISRLLRLRNRYSKFFGSSVGTSFQKLICYVMYKRIIPLNK